MMDRLGMQRLEAATGAWLRFRTSGATDKDAFLADHEDLRDLLEPMLEDDDGIDEADGDSDGGDDTASALVGRTLGGDFRLIRQIGRGGMGIVFEALQLSLDRQVAVKMLMHSHDQAKAIARFKREAVTAGRLRHDGIVDVYAVGTDGSLHFFAMELVDGTPLDRLVSESRGRPVDTLGASRLGGVDSGTETATATSVGVEHAKPRGYVRRALTIIADVADALDHAHEAGVIHRDVKPSNILLRKDGRPVLTDFGLAREDRLPSVTRTGDFAGTPYYVSPQQAAGASSSIDRRTDVFSLGVTLYELLTLRRPFEGGTTQRVLENIRSRDPADPRRFNARIGSDLVAVLMKALEKDPRKRYATARDFAADLRNILELRPVTARRWTRIRRLRRWIRREPLRATLAAVLIIGVPTLSFLSGYVLVKQDQITVGAERLREIAFDRKVAEGFLRLAELRYEEAKPLLRAALEMMPGDPEALAGLVTAELHFGSTDRALALLARHEDVVERSVGLQWLRKRVEVDVGTAPWEQLQTPPEAGTPLDRFLIGFVELHKERTSPSPERAQEILRYFDDAVVLSERPRATFHLMRARTAADCKDHARAIQSTNAMLERWPDTPLLWQNVGICLQHADPVRAIDAFQRAIEVDPDDVTAHINLGVVSRKLGDYETAEAAFARAIEINDERPGLWTRYAALLDDMERYDEQLTALERAVEIEPTGDNMRLVAEAHFQRGRRGKALEAYGRGTQAHPGNGPMQHGHGFLLMQAGRLEEAEEHIRAACKLMPDNVRTWYTLGVVLQEQDRDADAGEAFEKAAEVDPEFYPAHHGVGATLNARRRYEDAIAPLRRSVAIKSDYDRSNYALGIALANSGHHDEAKYFVLRALDLRPRKTMRNLREEATRMALSELARPCARVLCEAAIAREPDAEWAHETMLTICRSDDDPFGERAELRRWTRVHPDSPEPWIELAKCVDDPAKAAALRDPDLALMAARKAVELADDDPTAHLFLAETLIRADDHAAATQLLGELESTTQVSVIVRAEIERLRQSMADGRR